MIGRRIALLTGMILLYGLIAFAEEQPAKDTPGQEGAAKDAAEPVGAGDDSRPESAHSVIPVDSATDSGDRPKWEPLNTPTDLFQPTKVREVHLRFSVDQWEAMEPKDNGRPRGFGFRGGPAPNLSTRLAPAILHHGKATREGHLEPDAFRRVAESWFAEWDKNTSTTLDAEELEDGLNSVAPAPRGGMNLQGPEGGRNGIAAAFGIEYVYVHADLELNGHRVRDVGVRFKGGGTFLESRESLKRPMKISLGKFVKGQTLAGVSKINLANCVTDPSYMNEVLAHQLYRDAGVPSPRTTYAHVFVTIPDNFFDRELFGLYSIVENVDEQFASHAFGVEGGALFKPVTANLFAYLGQDWKQYNQTYDPKGDPTEDQLQRMIALCRFVTYADDAEFAASLGDFVDLDNLARYLAVMVYLSDFDGILGPGQNFYMYLHPKTNKFSFIPWDQDRSFGQFRGTPALREQLSIHQPWQGNVRFLERVYQVDAFKRQYIDHLEKFSKTIFQPERIATQIDTMAQAIRHAVRDESPEKLSAFDKVVAGETTQPSGQGRRFGGTPSKPVKPFVKVRAQSIIDQLSGAAEGERFDAGGRGRFPGFGDNRRQFSPTDALLAALDTDNNGELTSVEFVQGFEKWFATWNTDDHHLLTEDELRTGIDASLPIEPR